MDDRKRAVAYIRVSTKSDAQLHSFGYQESYWRDAIAASNQYDFAGIYSDFGISGRSLNRRPQLQRLIADAEQKKFDVVFTKSVARFGRNVEEIVATVRKLREYGIRIFFEKEQIDTFDPNMELYMTLAASIAENDLKIYSENMTWSIRERYKKGWISIGSQIFGYRMNKENNTLIVEPTEAETVKRIYDLYEEGLGQVAISHVLEEEQRANIYGEVKWDVGAIRYILTNEKYKGCALTQKGIYVHGIKQKNDNLAPQWYMENTHEAIITPEQFDRVQELIKERARKSKGAKPGDYVFARKIDCGCCGGGYSHKFNNTNKPWRNEIWICSKQNTYGAGHCTNTRIKDEVLKNLFVECYNEFVRENGNTDELMELRDSQRKLLEQERELNALRVNRMIEISDYNAEIAKVREQITECNKQIALHEMRGARKEDLVEIKEFDDSKVEIFLEKAVVLNHTITFTFINGMSISREYTNGHGGNTAGWLDRRLDRLSKEGKQ